MRNKTYNQIIQYLEEFADKHIDVMRFEEEDEDQMSSITSMDEKFPMMFVTPTGSSFGYDMNDYSLRIYCYDRLTKDRSNSTNIRSKTNQILNDLDVWLRKEPTLPFEISDVTDAQPFSSELMAGVSGWYIDVLIDSPSFSVCEIPFSEVPKLPLGVCVGPSIIKSKCPVLKTPVITITVAGHSWTIQANDDVNFEIFDSSGTIVPSDWDPAGETIYDNSDPMNPFILGTLPIGSTMIEDYEVTDSSAGVYNTLTTSPGTPNFLLLHNGYPISLPATLAVGDRLSASRDNNDTVSTYTLKQ